MFAQLSNKRWSVVAACLALAAMTFAVFGQTLGHEFIYFDDNEYVFNNPMVFHGLTGKDIRWAFTGSHSHNWHPLTWLSHMLDCQIYGLHPLGHHLTNVLLHTATVIGLFLVLRQMTGGFWRSAFVAAVFGIHPLRAESVAWVAERKDVLSGLFFILTIGAYIRYARLLKSRKSNLKWAYALVLLLFALGLMCKPMLVTLPAVLLLLDYWPLRRGEPVKRLILEKLPLLALSAISGVITIVAQGTAIQSTDAFSMPVRLGNAVTTVMIYLRQMVYPAGLAVFYPYPRNGPPWWEVALAGLLATGISALAIARRRPWPWLFTGWFWYLVMLLPVIGIIQVSVQARADRYTYLPQIGIYVAVTWLVAELRVSRILLGSLMTATLVVLTMCGWRQTAYWKDSETIWVHTLDSTKDNYLAHFNLGVYFFQTGALDDAIAEYRKGLQIKSDHDNTHYNLANALREKGEITEAIAEYQTALKIKPNNLEALDNLGSLYSDQGRTDDAIAQYRKVLQINPNYTDAHYNLGIALQRKGEMDQAKAEYKRTLELDPENAHAHYSLGDVLHREGKDAQAITHLERALALDAGNPWTKNNLAWLLATSSDASVRNGNRAADLAAQANGLGGGANPFFLHSLAAALAEAGRFPEAVDTAQTALRLAVAQSNASLAAALQSELKLYQASKPFHAAQQNR